MPMRERTLVVIAVGLALATLAILGTRLVETESYHGGWFAYAPDTEPVFADGPGLSPAERAWADAGIWLAAVALWVGVSLRIYRRPTDGSVDA